MTAAPLSVPKLHPTARTVAVTSGKGGAAKSTTVAAIAARLATDGVNVIVVDMDVPAPNAAIVAEVPVDAELTANLDTAEIIFPWSPFGYRVVSPTFFEREGSAASMATAARFANEVDVVVYDLPGGWTDAQTTVIENFVDVILAVSPPTATALSDHEAHLSHVVEAVKMARSKVQGKDRRRKVEFPETAVYSVETLSSYIGTSHLGAVARVRRLDAVPPEEARARFEAAGVPFAATIPPAVDVKALAATDEIGVLAALVTKGE